MPDHSNSQLLILAFAVPPFFFDETVPVTALCQRVSTIPFNFQIYFFFLVLCLRGSLSTCTTFTAPTVGRSLGSLRLYVLVRNAAMFGVTPLDHSAMLECLDDT